MPVLELSPVELKALWLCAESGSKMLGSRLAKDPLLDAATERILERVWRLHREMPPKEAA